MGDVAGTDVAISQRAGERSGKGGVIDVEKGEQAAVGAQAVDGVDLEF